MSKVEHYRETLRALDEWEPFLLRESGLPGPRGNLELVQAAADLGSEAQFRRWLAYDAERAPTNSPQEFLAVCGVVGLGRLLAEGRVDLLPVIRACACDPRWRTREGVAMALQRWGAADMDALLAAMVGWSRGSLLERRAAVAALCEPALLVNRAHVEAVLRLLDAITASLQGEVKRGNDDFKVLRKALGYGWSVVVAAWPDAGKLALERWFSCSDRDVIWVMKENLKKSRLMRMDAAWVEASKKRLGMG